MNIKLTKWDIRTLRNALKFAIDYEASFADAQRIELHFRKDGSSYKSAPKSLKKDERQAMRNVEKFEALLKKLRP